MTSDTKIGIGLFMGLGLFAALVIASIHSLKPESCGCIRDGKIVPGYLLKGRFENYCAECEDLKNPDHSNSSFLEDELRACPKEVLATYNLNAKRLNHEMVEKGYKPRYEIYKEKP
jgi:hypothetical protein